GRGANPLAGSNRSPCLTPKEKSMNNAVDKLMNQAGTTISESIGGNGIKELVQQPPMALPVHDAGKLAGRTRNHQAGIIDLNQVMPDPDQPRQHFAEEEIDRLAESMKAKGQLQNIRVRWSEKHGKWVIISGERRYRAALKAGLPTLKCEFVERQLSEAEVLEDQLIENCLREDLNALEQALSFSRLKQLKGCTQEELARSLSVSMSHVSKTLAVLDLPEDLQAEVKSGALPGAVAYEISRLASEEAQRQMAQKVKEDNLTAAQTALLVQQQ